MPEPIHKSYARVAGRMPPKDHKALAAAGPTFILGMGEEIPALIRTPADVTPRIAAAVSSFVAGSSLSDGADSGLPNPPLFVEVGSGMGDQAVSFAVAHPQVRVLAIEVFAAGLAATARAALREGASNLRVLRADAAVALAHLLPPGTAREVWTFFPDPWPKARHQHRRIVSPPFTELVARALTPGGVWRLATDWEDYAQQMAEVVGASPDFLLARGQCGSPYVARWPERALTKFERRGLREGRRIADLSAKKLAEPAGSPPISHSAPPAPGGDD